LVTAVNVRARVEIPQKAAPAASRRMMAPPMSGPDDFGFDLRDMSIVFI
jgi:hypothetical protein